MRNRLVAGLVRRGARSALSSSYRSFERRLEGPAASQAHLLEALTRDLARTEYGRSLGVREAESYDELVRKAPIVTYDEFRPWIDRQASSDRPIVTSRPIIIFEETSGSSGAHKLIPYTAALLASFDRLFRIWVYDLLAYGPDLQSGKTFMSVSPAVRENRRTPSGVPIGFDDDMRYLSGLARTLFGSRFLLVPGLSRVRDISMYRRIIAARLIAERDLEIISIWSPTYLGSLLDFAAEHRTTLLRDLERGSIEVEDLRIPVGRRPDIVPILDHAGPIEWPKVWPNLKLLSCWTDAAAALFIGRLRKELPGVVIQGKGLLATEAPITLPLCRAPAPVPLLDEVFLEFESDEGDVRRLHELEDGREYGVIVSQKGGLTRYRMNDRVQVAGRYRATPCLRFVGRARSVSDLAGEKLHERFVREALGRVPIGAGTFTFLVPVPRPAGVSYYLCITDGDAGSNGELGMALESELERAFQYRQARALGQLAPLRTVLRRDAKERYTRHFLARGMKWGDIKYETLISPVNETELEELTS